MPAQSRRLAALVAAAATISLLALTLAHVAKAALSMNTQTPSSFTFFNACTGEDVAVTGLVHLVITSTATESMISGTFHSEFHATGIGQSSGLGYEEQVIANSSFKASLVNGEATYTFVGRINILAPGAQNNQSSPIFMHTTINAAGEIASLKVEAPTVFCQ